MEGQQVIIWSPGDVDPATITDPQHRQIAIGQAVAYARQMLVVAAKSHFELGRCLSFLSQLVSPEEFRRILADELEGMSSAQAQKYINYYDKIRHFPNLKDFGERSFAKAICLLNTLEHEELERIAASPKKLDRMDMMSVAEMKRELKRLREGMQAAVREEVRALEAERDALLDERDAALEQLKALLKKDDPDPSHIKRMIADMESAINIILAVSNGLKDIADLSPALASQLETVIYGCAQAGQRLWQAWQAVHGDRA